MKAPTKSPAQSLARGQPLTLAHVVDGVEGLVISDMARAVAARTEAPATSLLVVARDGPRMAALAKAIGFFAPDIEVQEFPAWDCLPYDRVSPHAETLAQRMTTLSRLARLKGREHPSVLITTVNAVSQRVPAREVIARQALSAAPGNRLDMASVVNWLELIGFGRASTVREPGEYAVRGGILDLVPPGMDMPVRLDFFGDTLESIRTFDPETQRSEDQWRAFGITEICTRTTNGT
jgi:transcription-repair coupling factor (superfamily II helicase)